MGPVVSAIAGVEAAAKYCACARALDSLGC